MEIQELKNYMDTKFEDLDKRLTVCFKSIDDKNIVTDKAIDEINRKVITHDHWLWAMRGIGAVIVTVLAVIGIKIRF